MDELIERCRHHAKFLDECGLDGDGQDILDLIEILNATLAANERMLTRIEWMRFRARD
jgi:hypothetical protein